MKDTNSECLAVDDIALEHGHSKIKVDRLHSQIRVLAANAGVGPGCNPHMA